MSSEQSPTDIPITMPYVRLVRLQIEFETKMGVDELDSILGQRLEVSDTIVDFLRSIGLRAEAKDLGMWMAQVIEVPEPTRN